MVNPVHRVFLLLLNSMQLGDLGASAIYDRGKQKALSKERALIKLNLLKIFK
jgi:hypothetical protein